MEIYILLYLKKMNLKVIQEPSSRVSTLWDSLTVRHQRWSPQHGGTLHPQISILFLSVYIYTHIHTHTRSRRSSPLVLQYRSVQDVRDWAIKWSSAPSSSLLSSFSRIHSLIQSPFIPQFIHLLITYHISHLPVTYSRVVILLCCCSHCTPHKSSP